MGAQIDTSGEVWVSVLDEETGRAQRVPMTWPRLDPFTQGAETKATGAAS